MGGKKVLFDEYNEEPIENSLQHWRRYSRIRPIFFENICGLENGKEKKVVEFYHVCETKGIVKKMCEGQ